MSHQDLMFRSPLRGSEEYLYNQYLRKHLQSQNKGQTTKDSERLKTYKAEWAFRAKVPSLKRLKDIKAAQKYIDKVTGSVTYTKIDCNRRPNTQISCRAKKSSNGFGSAGLAYNSHIVLDTYTGMDIYTVLHELAHTAGHRHHGRSFRQALVTLVSRFMGRESATMLKAEFKASKLACGEPRKPKTFDQWLAAKQRMEKMRGLKSA